ncbi:hypothetical protein OG900_05640 [Streptomyces sp. NBC_00433]
MDRLDLEICASVSATAWSIGRPPAFDREAAWRYSWMGPLRTLWPWMRV